MVRAQNFTYQLRAWRGAVGIHDEVIRESDEGPSGWTFTQVMWVELRETKDSKAPQGRQQLGTDPTHEPLRGKGRGTDQQLGRKL